MLTGSIEGTIDALRIFVEDDRYRVFGLTNWSAETYPIAEEEYEFLQWFDGVVVYVITGVFNICRHYGIRHNIKIEDFCQSQQFCFDQ